MTTKTLEKHANGAISAPAEVNRLWTILVGGLVVVVVLCLGGVIYTVVDGNDKTSPDVLVTVFSSALTGLIGLFVRAPG